MIEGQVRERSGLEPRAGTRETEERLCWMWWFVGLPLSSWLLPGLLTFSAPNMATLTMMVVILVGTSLVARHMLSY